MNEELFLRLIQEILNELVASREDKVVSASLTETLSQLSKAYDCYLTSSLHKTK